MSTALARRGAAPGRHVYDVIVAGGQLAGALAAGLLAKRGLQVLYVPHDGLSAPYTHGEAKLAHAPFILPPLKAAAALDAALMELGLHAPVSRALRVVALQLLEAERWFELSHDEKRRGPELARALGDGAEAFDELTRQAEAAAASSDAFFASQPDLPPEGFFNRWTFKRSLRRYRGLDTDTPLAEPSLLRSLLPVIACVERPAALTRARVLGRTLAGPAIYPGGREGFLHQLAERARELGADVQPADEAIERLSLERDAVGVRLARTDTVYRAPLVVAAMDLDVVARLLPEKPARAAQPSLARVTASRALLTMHWVLPERGLPRGLGELALLPSPALEGGAALLQVSQGPTAEQRVLSVTAPAPLAIKTAGEPAVRALLGQIHAALERVMPFTKAHVTLESTPWLDAPHVVAGRAEPTPLFALGPEAWLGVSGLETGSPWKRIVLASRQVLPGLGVEGEVLAARRAVQRVEARLKKQDPLRAGRPG